MKNFKLIVHNLVLVIIFMYFTLYRMNSVHTKLMND